MTVQIAATNCYIQTSSTNFNLQTLLLYANNPVQTNDIQSTINQQIIYNYHGQLKINKHLQNSHTDVQRKPYKLTVYKLRMYNITIHSNKSNLHVTTVIMMG